MPSTSATRNPTPKSSSSRAMDRPTSRGFWHRGQCRVEAAAAAGLVGPLCANQDAVLARDKALRVVCRIATDDADGQRLGDVLGDREQVRHRLERFPEIVPVSYTHLTLPT